MTDKPIKIVPRETYYEQRKTFAVKVPEISQVEATNACNFTCDFCPRDEPGYKRSDVFMDPVLANLIADRDLGGSHFVEFQLSGEPTLHKRLPEIIEPFVGKVMTGLSTNGSSMHGEGILKALMLLDYITVSVDSIRNYSQVRPGGTLRRLLDNIDKLVTAKVALALDNRVWSKGHPGPHIDLQLIEFPEYQQELELLQILCDKMGWSKHVEIRTVPDCFEGVTRGNKMGGTTELCLNPWTSVSVHSDGDVVPCCYAFGKQVVYGNLYEKSLEEIWATSPEVERMRELHMKGGEGNGLCETCYQRSPMLLHWDLYKNVVTKRLIHPRNG